jgi:hypothetical protein
LKSGARGEEVGRSMAERPLPIVSGDTPRPTTSAEDDRYAVSTAKYEVTPRAPGPPNPPINDEVRWPRVLISLIVIIIGAIVAFQIYRIRRHDLLGAEAVALGETFIQSSPVVEEDLGTAKAVKETNEEHRLGSAPGWYVNFDVSGKHRSGVVEIRLRATNGQWLVPSAELKMGPRRVVNLR